MAEMLDRFALADLITRSLNWNHRQERSIPSMLWSIPARWWCDSAEGLHDTKKVLHHLIEFVTSDFEKYMTLKTEEITGFSTPYQFLREDHLFAASILAGNQAAQHLCHYGGSEWTDLLWDEYDRAGIQWFDFLSIETSYQRYLISSGEISYDDL